jgi:hypothetical protein
MTREQQVKAALKLSKLPRDRYEAARASIENALDIMVDATIAHNVWKAARSKAAHKAERAYHQALCRLRTTHKAALATGAGVPLYPTLAHIESAIKETEPRRYELLYRARGTKPTFAVALAYELLMEWWGSDEFISTTRKGTWWRLSAILYGDPDVDLFQHLRAFKPELSPFRRGRAQFYTEPTELSPFRLSRYVPNSK